jgi:SAM-dependent methyltransferase
MEQAPTDQPTRYPWGHEEGELARITSTGRYLGDLTEHVLRLAGIDHGMRVLDVGCGPGDVTFLAAKMVGSEGAVIGVDKSEEAIGRARERAAAAGLANVRFLTHDLVDLALDEPVDALIGRLVLQYVTDPARVLRHLITLVKPGGVVAFQEADMDDGPNLEPVCPVYEAAIQRIKQVFIGLGTDPRIGIKLGRIIQEAGLPAPQMIRHSRVEHGPNSPLSDLVAQNTRQMLPLMQRTGVATPEGVDVDTLAERVRAEATALDATLIASGLVGAWTRKPVTSQ